MGLFGSLFDLAIDIVKLPVAVAVDTITLGEAEATKHVVKEVSNDLHSLTD